MLSDGELTIDSAQLKLLENLDLLHLNLLSESKRLFTKKNIKGIYIYGEVGRGKTKIMDIFFKSLKIKEKQRIHFHRFMKNIHDELKSLSGKKDPISILVKKLNKKYRVFCLDEFYVEDIGDAMILSRFLDKLFLSGTTLITTSNSHPDHLYKDGLHRERFYPTINTIIKNTSIYKLESKQDYRLRELEKSEIHVLLQEDRSGNILENNFKALMHGEEVSTNNITILGRSINTIKKSGGVIWFDFKSICDGPRSTNDYIEICKEFHTLFISNIPILTEDQDNQARRFIALIDECYERNVNLLLSSQVSILEIYRGSKLSKVFKRTYSRIKEMTSKEYLSRPHLH